MTNGPAWQKYNQLWGAHYTGMQAEFERTKLLVHSGEKGASREGVLRDLLRKHLPSRYGVTTGFVIDQGGKISPQIDVMIYDRVSDVPLVPAEPGQADVLAAESLLAVIEVKSSINRAEIETSIQSLKSIYDMRPYGDPWGVATSRERQSDGLPRFYSTIFAYSTDLIELTWGQRELVRVREVIAENEAYNEYLNSLAVLDRGCITPAAGMVACNSPSVPTLGFWITGLRTFLDRESRRSAQRPLFPWTSYQLVPVDTNVPVLEADYGSPRVKRYSKAQKIRYRRHRV